MVELSLSMERGCQACLSAKDIIARTNFFIIQNLLEWVIRA